MRTDDLIFQVCIEKSNILLNNLKSSYPSKLDIVKNYNEPWFTIRYNDKYFCEVVANSLRVTIPKELNDDFDTTISETSLYYNNNRIESKQLDYGTFCFMDLDSLKIEIKRISDYFGDNPPE